MLADALGPWQNGRTAGLRVPELHRMTRGSECYVVSDGAAGLIEDKEHCRVLQASAEETDCRFRLIDLQRTCGTGGAKGVQEFLRHGHGSGCGAGWLRGRRAR